MNKNQSEILKFLLGFIAKQVFIRSLIFQVVNMGCIPAAGKPDHVKY
ncbi:hypothetical protein [Persicitalea jodogahamensis]|nr:hypothetical protein [Persicitalea jodogahamensis]